MTNRTHNKQFTIIRFEPQILLYHKHTKKTYEYLQPSTEAPLHSQITHTAMLRPIIYNNGLLYLRGHSTLQIQLQNRRRGHNVIYFQQEEILNTFTPLLECLMFLHKNGIIHGGISPANIVITDQQEIKLKDWMIDPKENIYYGGKKRTLITQQDDLIAVGKIMAQAAILSNDIKIWQEKDINQVLQKLARRYSKGFVFGLTVLLKNNNERFGQILNYFNNQQKYLADLELNTFYNSLKKQQQKKKQFAVTNQNKIPITKIPITTLPLKQIISLTQSPVKKSAVNGSLSNKTKRSKEDENKRISNEELKKKQFDKINKIIQRSNQFVHELMARKNQEQILKKIVPKSNVAANFSMFQPKKVAKQGTLISPTKRFRTSSKKK